MKLFVVLFALAGCALAAPTIEERVVGGSAAARNQFPYQVSMQWGILTVWQHICGGSIIAGRTVLTAAHCITETPNLGSFRIRAGLLNLNDNVAGMQTIAVQTTVINPNYAGGVNPHDIALLRLSAGFTWGAGVAAISLPAAGSIPTGSATLSGWGSTSTTQTPSMPNTMQWVTKPLLTIAQCSSALTSLMGNPGPLDPSNVCTGPLTGGVSACSGDSGGPLAQNNQVIGIVSWGIMPCGTTGAPSVYVRTSNYIAWINANILA